MRPRCRAHPAHHLSIGVPQKHRHELACGRILFIGGQADIGAHTKVSRPNDLPAQTAIAIQGIHRVLAGRGADAADLLKVTASCVTNKDANEYALLRDLAIHAGQRLHTAVEQAFTAGSVLSFELRGTNATRETCAAIHHTTPAPTSARNTA